MALHPYEEEDPYGANTGENATVLENGVTISENQAPVRTDPVKRMRWATQRHKPTSARDKRRSILDRLHKRNASSRSNTTDGTDGDNHKGAGSTTEGEGHGRTIYFNRSLPPEAKNEEGHPLTHYPRNKIRTAKYTALSFIPKNLWFQFHNIANIYFFFIILLSVRLSYTPCFQYWLLTKSIDRAQIWRSEPWAQCRTSNHHRFPNSHQGRH